MKHVLSTALVASLLAFSAASSIAQTAASEPAPLSRAEVKAETAAAVRAGNYQVGDEGRTAAEADPARYAGAPAKPPKFKVPHRAKKPAAAASVSASN